MFQSRNQHVDRECIFAGLLSPNARPFLLPRPIINEHVYFSGQTGSGKTSLGFILFLIQLAKSWDRARRDYNGGLWLADDGSPVFQPQPRPPIFILDLKGDPALFNTARIQAKENGYEFKFFSCDDRRPGQIFDVFQNLQPCPAKYLAELLLLALGILHGEGYGKSHFTRANLARLTEALVKNENPMIRSWRELYRLVRDSDIINELPSARDADELLNAIHGMMHIERMTAGGRATDNIGVIHMKTAIQRRQMIYLWLPSGIAPMSIREIGKFALYAIHEAANGLTIEGQGTQCYIFIDEFHMLAGQNMEQLLTQARSAGITFLIANQYARRLAEEELDLRRMVYECTRVKQFFTMTDPLDIDELAKVSGQTTRWLATQGQSVTYKAGLLGWELDAAGFQSSQRETLVPRFDIDLPRQATEDRVGSIVVIQRGEGLAQFGGVPQYVQALWPMEPWQYARRNSFKYMPWQAPKDDPPPQAHQDSENATDSAGPKHSTGKQRPFDEINEKHAGDRRSPSRTFPPQRKDKKAPGT